MNWFAWPIQVHVLGLSSACTCVSAEIGSKIASHWCVALCLSMAVVLEVSSIPSWFTDVFDDDSSSAAPRIALGEPRVRPYTVEDLRRQAQGFQAPSWRPEGTLWFKASLLPWSVPISVTALTGLPHHGHHWGGGEGGGGRGREREGNVLDVWKNTESPRTASRRPSLT